MLDTADVHRRRPLRVVLRTVDVGPGRRVQDEIRVEPLRRRERDVPLGTRERRRAGERLDERGAELAAGARYEDAAPWSRSERIGDRVLQRSTTRGSFHGTPFSSGSAGSYSSVTK